MAEMTAAGREGEARKPQVMERDVVAYLREYPDLFARHPDLLEVVELRHKAGSAVSLIERQVDMLRAHNQRLEDRLTRLMDAARDNEKRADSVHRLARTLIRAPTLGAVIAGLARSMREDFDIQETVVGVASTVCKRHDIDGLMVIEADGRLARTFENFFRTRLIECGPLDAERAQILFPKAAVLPQSLALVPLEKDKSLGFMALGACDPSRFQPRQGKMFLEMTAELIAAALRARL